ncbi:MAG: M23 family metallopeptidase, partial [Corynebacterium casei]
RPAEGAFTSGFGPRWGSFHAGIDIANSNGTPILAVMDGTVIDSGPASGYGNWIRIKHEDGSVSVYGHMESLDVAVGQQVTAGQKIAGMGNLGFSTGTHLHFEIHPDGNTAVDPIPWFAERGVNIA